MSAKRERQFIYINFITDYSFAISISHHMLPGTGTAISGAFAFKMHTSCLRDKACQTKFIGYSFHSIRVSISTRAHTRSTDRSQNTKQINWTSEPQTDSHTKTMYRSWAVSTVHTPYFFLRWLNHQIDERNAFGIRTSKAMVEKNNSLPPN